MNISGKKEIWEAVAIAALTTLFNGIVQWGLDRIEPKDKEEKDKCKTCQK